MLLRATSAVGIAVGIGAWRWYCRRHHQGFEDEDDESESPREEVRQVPHGSFAFCVFMFNCLLGRSPEFRVCSKANSAKKGLCQVQHSKVSLAVIDLLDDIQGLLEVLEGDKSAAFPRFSSVFLGDSTVVGTVKRGVHWASLPCETEPGAP